MKVRFPLHFGVVVLSALGATFGLFALSGCSGGWGELKPAIARQQGRAQTVISGQSAPLR